MATHDSRATLGTHDDGTFTRTAVRIGADGGISFVITDAAGRALWMVNAFISPSGDWSNVDLIPMSELDHLRALAFADGRQVINTIAPKGNLIAVEARADQKPGG